MLIARTHTFTSTSTATVGRLLFMQRNVRFSTQDEQQQCTEQQQQQQQQQQSSGNEERSLLSHLKQRIQISGPITVSSYMKECLSNPVWGYYMKKDVFGSKGDFTTSPEMSQMFGELVAVWLYIQW